MEAVSGQDVVRLQTSALAAAEKRLLVRIAERLPARVNSDHLTTIGAAGMVLAGASYWLASVQPVGLLLAVIGLGINWFGDSLDGTVARVRGCQRPRYGYYVDHVLDAVGAACLLGGLGLSGYMSPIVALVLLVSYFLLMIEIYLAAAVVRAFRMGFAGLGPTELRVLLAAGTLALYVHPYATIAGRRVLVFDVGGVVAAIGLLAVFAVCAVRNARALYLAEPMVRSAAGERR
jgi:archaetidylinositol phosphate synthase